MSGRSATGRQGVPATAAVLRQAPDERLVTLVGDGSPAAFEEVAARYRRPLHLYCARLVGTAQAEDVVQQALLRAYIALRRGDLRHVALRPWLYRIARNCAIDVLRSRPPEHEQLDLEFDGVPQPPRLVEQKEEIGRLVSAMRGLPEGQRRALTLRELEGRSYSEISAELGQTGPCVRQLIFRARETLRSGLGALVPVGLFRRLLGHQPALADAHHTATAAKLPGGGTLEAVGAMAAATLTLLAGSAGVPSSPAHGARPSAPLTGPLHPGDLGTARTGGDGRAIARDRDPRMAAVSSTGQILTGGTRLALPARAFTLAVPAAERSAAGRSPVRAEGEAAASAPELAPAESSSDAPVSSAAEQPAAGDTGATGPSGPGQPESTSGGAPVPGDETDSEDGGGAAIGAGVEVDG